MIFELWCWRRLLRFPWTARRSNQSILKEMFIGRTDVEAETPLLWPWCEELTHRKRPDARKDWGWEEKGTTEDEIVGWYHQPNGHGFEWTLGVYPNSRSLSQWWHPTISSSVILFSCLQSFPASGSFQMSQFFASGGQTKYWSFSFSISPSNEY